MITSENGSVARESSRVIILKSRLDSTGHSAYTSEVRDIFDSQTHVPNDWWQLMCSRVLQPRHCRNSMTAPVRNITVRVIAIIIGAFGTVLKGLLKGREELEIGERAETI